MVEEEKSREIDDVVDMCMVHVETFMSVFHMLFFMFLSTEHVACTFKNIIKFTFLGLVSRGHRVIVLIKFVICFKQLVWLI